MKRLSKAVQDRVGRKGPPLLQDEHVPTSDDNSAHSSLQLVLVLKQNGVGEICRTIKAEIDTIWAVQSAFKTLASVGHFYFSCGETVFSVNPADGFYDSDGLLLALFALKKFPHHREHKHDQQAAWYALALLNALTTSDSYHIQLIETVFSHRGVPLIARAIAMHVQVEEIALEGFQLLERIATVSHFFAVINRNHVLELAYHALSLYKGMNSPDLNI
ncbi:hypothetical protein DYB38_002260 [Aphanomyces astaci]|uniref:ELMO domain-containing protein n=1 Tax=Aphanomyces astaci TaxID=112090 RepID=A0A397DEF4_APHAT|nr:hypothetical protein DYB38_002260 [Aphanomyces astaci]